MGLLKPQLAALAAVIGLCACMPELDSDLSKVEAPRVLALRSEPAEAGPGQSVTVHALVAAPDGTLAEAELDWSLCLARRPLTTLAPIAPECAALVDDPAILDALGSGVSVSAKVPTDVCRRFGPEPPVSTPGEPTGRPVDPDPTGGYFQPILAQLLEDDSINLLQLRITCGLAGATQAQAADFALRYRPNIAPAIESVTLDGEVELLDADPPVIVSADQPIDLRVRWAKCPTEPGTDCAGAETHVFFDPISLEVATRREAITVAWYSTAGQLGEARTGRAQDELATHSDNTWLAPSEAGPAWFWVVLRDDRGGVGWASFSVEVEEG